MLNFNEKTFDTKPFPHIEYLNIFNKEILNKIVNNWPSEKLFFDEIPGVKLFSLLNKNNFDEPEIDKEFWENITYNYVPKIFNNLNYIFYPFLYEKYKKLFPKLYVYQLDLMTSTENFALHGMHTHHYHNPNYLYTMLLYLDKGRNECIGTDLYSPKNKNCFSDDYSFTKLVEKNLLGSDGLKHNNFNEDVINARLYPEYEMEIAKTCNFENNKLMAFLDSPISYHGVGPQLDNYSFDKRKTNYTFGQRKILRMHVGVNEAFIKQKYRISKKEYFDQRRTRKLSSELFSKIQNEIKLLRLNKKHRFLSYFYYYYSLIDNKLFFKIFYKNFNNIKRVYKWLKK
tara:strand:+ start:1035 stop:2060 length:1026 start_codon:yes stop_codon:yes gene_type:complete